MTRIHRPLTEAIIENLLLIFNQNQKADKVIDSSLKSNKKWGSRDRRFIAENTYDVIRWWRLLKFCANIDQRKIREEALFWQMLGTWFVLKELVLPEWEEFAVLDRDAILKKSEEGQKIRKIRESVPDWIDEKGNEETPNWEQEIQEMNKTADVYLRVNTLLTNKEDLMSKLTKEGLQLEELKGVKDGLRLRKRRNLKSLNLYNKGHFEIQDAGSQLIGEFLDLDAGMRVIDACAGAGGKALHMATIMQNKGEILAMDIKKNKLIELEKRALRNRIDIIRTEMVKKDNINKREKSVDRLLLDVPCSGLGVLKRNPDAKWKLKPEFLEEIKEIQSTILQDYSQMVKPGGKVVYATCSVLRSENEDQVSLFLSNNSDFKLEEEKRISPAETGFDGFYMARLSRV